MTGWWAQTGGVKLTGGGGLENYRNGHRPKMVTALEQ